MKNTTLWITGLQASGKTTMLNLVKKRHPYIITIDADYMRQNLNSDLGFSDADITENIRRLAYVCKLLNDSGFEVAVACVSHRRKDREMARAIIGESRYIEHYIDCPKNILKKRQQELRKGMAFLPTEYELPTTYKVTTTKGVNYGEID